jgi:hypothetical protein
MMSDAVDSIVTISMRPVRYEDQSWGVELIVSGLSSEQQAEAAMQHMQRLFCAGEIIEQ